jgi:hypothetical protein
MNITKFFFLLLFCCFISSSLFAQDDPQIARNVEVDLYKYLQKIVDWRYRQDTLANIDSLDKANKRFGEKLKEYTSQFPVTITAKFSTLVDDNLYLATAPDGMFRIYSWDTWLGGGEHAFDNVFQYKVNDSTISDFQPPGSADENNVTYKYTNLYVMKANEKTWYMAIYNSYAASKYATQGIRVFAIENGKLRDDVKLIKKTTGLYNSISYEYEVSSLAQSSAKPSIHFDPVKKIIFVPLITDYGDEKVTNEYVTYKFTGQYFEKVKN